MNNNLPVDYLDAPSDWERAFNFDFSAHAEFQETIPQTITGTPTVTVFSGPAITISTPAVSGALVQVFLSALVPNADYVLRCRIVLSGGGKLSQLGGLNVGD